MNDHSQDRSVPMNEFQIDLSEAFRQQVDFQIRILKAAIETLKEREELPPLPLVPPKLNTPEARN